MCLRNTFQHGLGAMRIRLHYTNKNITTLKNDNAEKYNPYDIAVKDIDFKLMHEIYFRPLCRYAERFDRQNAEDIVQDVLEAMWKKRDIIYIKEKLSSYLYTSVYNTCMKRWEHVKVEQNYGKQVQSMHKDGEPAHEENNSLFTMIVQEMKKKIRKIIKGMPKQRREIFLLRIKWKLSYKEIAEKLGVTEGTVKKQLNRAMTEILASFGFDKRKK